MNSNKLSGRLKKSQKAVDVFNSCPRCISPNVLKLDGEVVCTYCGWDSVELQSSLQNPMKIFSLREGVTQ